MEAAILIMLSVLIGINLNVVHWMDIFHCIFYYAPDLHAHTDTINNKLIANLF